MNPDHGRTIATARARVVAALATRFRDLDVAEDAFAEAAATAIRVWTADPPRDAGAWLWRAAVRKALDQRRRAAVRARAQPDPPPGPPTPEEALIQAQEPIADDRLRLIFVCNHPALSCEARVALTLKVVCGLAVERLARAFLAEEPAMRQRITRAKAKIRAARIPFEVPAPAEWRERLGSVLTTLEIAYAQAYEDAALAAPDAAELAREVLRLSALLVELIPQEPDALGLAALVRFAEARRHARIGPNGAMAPLDTQEIGLWRHDLIDEAGRLLQRAARLGRSGPYQIMAAIHAVHAARRETGFTAWGEIVELYDALYGVRPTPVVAVNRAVAVGEARGPLAGLQALEAVGPVARLAQWLPYQVARGHLLEQAGRGAEAAEALREALSLGPAPAERLFLQRRLADLTQAFAEPQASQAP